MALHKPTRPTSLLILNEFLGSWLPKWDKFGFELIESAPKTGEKITDLIYSAKKLHWEVLHDMKNWFKLQVPSWRKLARHQVN